MKSTEERIEKLEKTVEWLEHSVKWLISENKRNRHDIAKNRKTADNVGAMMAIMQILLYQEGVVDPERARQIFKDYEKQKTIETLEKGLAS